MNTGEERMIDPELTALLELLPKIDLVTRWRRGPRSRMLAACE
jgi:hypothetical protein